MKEIKCQECGKKVYGDNKATFAFIAVSNGWIKRDKLFYCDECGKTNKTDSNAKRIWKKKKNDDIEKFPEDKYKEIEEKE